MCHGKQRMRSQRMQQHTNMFTYPALDSLGMLNSTLPSRGSRTILFVGRGTGFTRKKMSMLLLCPACPAGVADSPSPCSASSVMSPDTACIVQALSYTGHDVVAACNCSSASGWRLNDLRLAATNRSGSIKRNKFTIRVMVIFYVFSEGTVLQA